LGVRFLNYPLYMVVTEHSTCAHMILLRRIVALFQVFECYQMRFEKLKQEDALLYAAYCTTGTGGKIHWKASNRWTARPHRQNGKIGPRPRIFSPFAVIARFRTMTLRQTFTFTLNNPHRRVALTSKLLLIMSILVGVDGMKNHYSDPEEDNVFSPPICETNQDGFGGSLGTDVIQVDYNYEMTLTAKDRTEQEFEGVVFNLERSLANFLLQTQQFGDIPCERRRAKSVKPPQKLRRTLNAVGVTINPPDEPISGCKYFIIRSGEVLFPTVVPVVLNFDYSLWNCSVVLATSK
jgi:hypothetical protein